MANKRSEVVMRMRTQLIQALNQEVDENFAGNKTKAAKAAEVERGYFTRICNDKDETAVDRLVEIGTNLGWQIELKIKKAK